MIQNITYKHVAHVVMLAFAAASLGNVHEFFSSAGHDGLSAWALAGALGAALVTISIMLTHIDREADTRAWATLAFVGVAVAVLSGSLQAATYLKALTPPTALMLGFGIPLIGEVALAFGVAAYEKAEQRREVTEAGQTVERIAVRAIVDVMQTVDVTRAKKQAERKIEGLIAAHVGATVAKLTPPQVHQNPPKPADIHTIDTEEQGQAFDENMPVEAESLKPNSPAALNEQGNRTRASLKVEAMQRTLEFFRTNPDASLSEAAQAVGRGRTTISGYLKELEEAGRVYSNGSVEVLSQ